MESYTENTDLTITLELDDGTEMECDVLMRYPMDDQQYIALVPVDDVDFEQVYLYRFSEGADGEPILTDIEDDDEYERACDRFDEILDEHLYNEAADEEELAEEANFKKD